MRPTRYVEQNVRGVLHGRLDTIGNALVPVKRLFGKAFRTQRVLLEVEANELVHQCVHLVISIEDVNVSCEFIVLNSWTMIAGWRWGLIMEIRTEENVRGVNSVKDPERPLARPRMDAPLPRIIF